MVENGSQRVLCGKGRPVRRPIANERVPGTKSWAGEWVGGQAIF